MSSVLSVAKKQNSLTRTPRTPGDWGRPGTAASGRGGAALAAAWQGFASGWDPGQTRGAIANSEIPPQELDGASCHSRCHIENSK